MSLPEICTYRGWVCWKWQCCLGVKMSLLIYPVISALVSSANFKTLTNVVWCYNTVVLRLVKWMNVKWKFKGPSFWCNSDPLETGRSWKQSTPYTASVRMCVCVIGLLYCEPGASAEAWDTLTWNSPSPSLPHTNVQVHSRSLSWCHLL